MKFQNFGGIVFFEGRPVEPMSVTRDFTEDEVKNNADLKMYINNKFFIPVDKAKEALLAIKPSKPQGEVTVKLDQKQTSDLISFGNVTSQGVENSKGDIIITGNESSKGKPGFDPEKDTKEIGKLGDIEDSGISGIEDDDIEDEIKDIPDAIGSTIELTSVQDADKDISMERSSFIVKTSDVIGGTEITTDNLVEKAVEKVAETTKSINEEFKDIPDSIIKFLSEKFFVQKKIIAESKDKQFLQDLVKFAGKDSIKKLAEQRLKELEKTNG